MLRVFAAKDPQRVQEVRELLAKNGISVVQRPNVWVADESDALRALKLVVDAVPKNESCHFAKHCDTCGSFNDAGSVYCKACLQEEFQRRNARRDAAEKSGALLMKISAAFFVAFLIADVVSSYFTVEVNRRGCDVFGIVCCVSSIVLLIWGFLEISRPDSPSRVVIHK